MPTQPTRSFTIKYGDKTIGINETRIDADGGKLRVNQSVESFSIEFGFVLVGSSAANLEAETNDLETAFKKIRQDVVITMNGQTAWSFSHSANTGYNSRATLSKTGGPKDGGLTRSFSCKIDVGLPFEDSGLTGRRSSQVSISFSPHRKIILNVSGEYVCHSTATTKKSAIENYHRAIDAYVTSVKSLLGGTAEDYSSDASGGSVPLVFERVSEEYSYDDQNKILNFSITEEELLYRQEKEGGAIDNPDIINQNLSVTMSRQWPGDSPHVGDKYRVTKVTVNYSCLVKKTLDDQTGEPKDLEALYTATIRPFMISEIGSITEFQGDQPAIVTITEDSVSYDKSGSSISATILADIFGSTGDVLQKSLTIADDEKPGNYLVPVWGTENNDDYLQKYRYSGPGAHVRTVTVVYRVLGQKMDDIKAKGFIADVLDMNEVTPKGNDWVLIGRHADSTVLEIGTPRENGTRQYIVTDYTLSTVSERYVNPSPHKDLSRSTQVGRGN